jgi:hypothetical protein
MIRCSWCGEPQEVAISPWDGLVLCDPCLEDEDTYDARVESAFRLAGRRWERAPRIEGVPVDVVDR